MRKKLTILGAGISGLGAAKLAKAKGLDVFISDNGKISGSVKDELNKLGISYEEEKHSESLILRSDEILKSPGIPPTAGIIRAAIKNEIPVIDELELAGRFMDKPAIIITGTNGKTTTTSLVAHLLTTCGLKATPTGNIGNSLAEEVLKDTSDVYVVECSSFQLDGMNQFKADVAILLNITPDHIDRYGSMDGYIASKMRISTLIKEGGWFIYNSDDHNINPENTPAKGFSIRNKDFASITNGQFQIGEDLHIPIKEWPLKGEHNLMNALAAISAVSKFTSDKEGMIRGLNSFKNVPHRLEWVGNIAGVDFVNDSKATNVEAVQYALGSFESPLIWIAGGVDKGNDYSSIADLVTEKVDSLVCLGINNNKLIEAFGGTLGNFSEVDSMQKAVRSAWEYAKPENTVLLSPACASFDLFNNYEDRGDQFKAEVLHLKETVERGTYE